MNSIYIQQQQQQANTQVNTKRAPGRSNNIRFIKVGVQSEGGCSGRGSYCIVKQPII